MSAGLGGLPIVAAPVPATDALTLSYVTMGFPMPSETFTSHDVRELARLGVNISVHALRPAHPLDARLTAERGLQGVRVTHARVASVFRGAAAAARAPGAAIALVAALVIRVSRQPRLFVRSLVLLPRVFEVFGEVLNERPDFVHLCWAHYPSMVAFLVQRAMPETAVSMSFSAYDIDLRYGLTAEVAAGAAWLRTLSSENVLEIAASFGLEPQRIEVVPDGIPTALFQAGPAGRARGRVVSVGRLDPEKGMLDVLEAFAAVKRSVPSATLEILGGGGQLSELERRVRELGLRDVRFSGHQPQEVVAEALASAEVFLFMSLTERVPNVVKEALAAGCACVVSDTFAIRDLVPSDRHGSVVAIHDVDAAAEACVRYLKDSRLRAEVARTGQEWVMRNYSLDSAIAAYLTAWRSALPRGGEVDVRH